MLFNTLTRQTYSLKRTSIYFLRAQSTIKVPPPTTSSATNPFASKTTTTIPPTPLSAEAKLVEPESTSSKDNGSGKSGKDTEYPNLPLYLSCFILGAGLAQFFPLSELAKFWISESLPPADSPYAENFRNNIETKLQKLPLYQKLYNDPDFRTVRAWNYVDSNTIDEVVTTGVMSVPGGIAIKPVLFYNDKTKESINIVHVGQRLCGYPFLIHGGILATLLDEIMKRSSSFKFGIDPVNEYKWDYINTESVELQYRFPTFANQFLIIKTRLNDKGEVEGRVETIEGRLLVNGLGRYSERRSSMLPVIGSSVSPAKERTGSWRFWPF